LTSPTEPGQLITRLAVDPPTILLCCIVVSFTVSVRALNDVQHRRNKNQRNGFN
jgi:hypothetical protein